MVDLLRSLVQNFPYANTESVVLGSQDFLARFPSWLDVFRHP